MQIKGDRVQIHKEAIKKMLFTILLTIFFSFCPDEYEIKNILTAFQGRQDWVVLKRLNWNQDHKRVSWKPYNALKTVMPHFEN